MIPMILRRFIAFFFAVLITPVAVADEAPRSELAVVTVKSPEAIQSVQKLPYYVGISKETAGSKVLSMNLVIIPPGGQAEAHYHDGFESAVYLIEGRVETCYGKGLKQCIVNEAGDFIFIPPNVPHQPRNLSKTEKAMAIVTRNDPSEQESVVHYSTDDK